MPDQLETVVTQVSALSTSQAEVPPHRSHDPSNNLKRTDPFQFGSRYLLPNDDPYEFNAWDHVEPSNDDRAYFEKQLVSQRESPVSEFDRNRFNANPEKWWNRFYTNNTANFFKDRKWLHQEFPMLNDVTKKNAGPKRILELGAGAGNTCFPILRNNENEQLSIYACDFSARAIQLIQEAESYDEKHITAEVWDIADKSLPTGLEENSVDVVLMIFVFSALHPKQWKQAVNNVWRVLRPGGEVCFRDYGRGDLAQVRMRKGRWMEENFYIRGDGTRVYFFEQEELKDIWGSGAFQEAVDEGVNEELLAHKEVGMQPDTESGRGQVNAENQGSTTASSVVEEPRQKKSVRKGQMNEAPFEILSLGVDRRLLVNRQKQLKMYRCWMQGRFRKPA
ncbi:MAG: hypothetical protein Q9190_002163 [Brigantiaea leucoxantha]